MAEPASTPELAYGYRPAVRGKIMHCVLPGGLLGEDSGHPTGYGWCGEQAYLVDHARRDWGRWPIHWECIPGYERHAVMTALGAGPVEGVLKKHIEMTLPGLAVYERLLELAYDGLVVVVGRGPDALWRLSGVGMSAWYARPS
jgi:hypothetical protein